MKNYYEILGFDEIVHHSKVADKHRQLSNIFILNRRKGNPDSEKFLLHTEAYLLLKNPKRKSKYDHLHSLKFDKEPVKRSKNAEKWEAEIAEKILKAQATAQEIVQLSNQELTARLKKLERGAWKDGPHNIIGFLLDLLLFIPS